MLTSVHGFAAKGVHVEQLSNGQKLIIAEDKSLPVCYVYAILKTGAIWDSPRDEGLTMLTGDMLLRGTTTRTREALQDALDQLGADMDVSVGAESIMVAGQTLKRNLDAFLEIFADVILHPRFDDLELQKEKREMIADLKQLREHDQALAQRFFKRALFEGHPYGLNVEGRESTLIHLTRKKVIERYHQFFARENLFFAASGDMDTKSFANKLSAYFKDFPKGKISAFAYPAQKQKKGIHILLVDKPARTQSQIIIGHLGIDAHHPDFFPLLVANNAFGGGFTARLMQEVRVKRGWSYGAYSNYTPRKKPGEFTIWVFPGAQETVDTLKLVLNLYQEYVDQGITEEEFNRSKSNLINEFAFKIDTAKKRVSQLALIELLDLPSDYLDTYQDKLKQVTLSEAIAAVQRQATPQNLTITIVCTASQLKRQLKALGKSIQITVKSYKAD